MRIIAAFVALSAFGALAHAQTEPFAARSGQVVRTDAGVKVGVIDKVNTDGSIRIIYGERFVTLPADSLKTANGAVSTSMARKDINKLRN